MQRGTFILICLSSILALTACPAVEVRCKCDDKEQKSRPYPKPPEIYEVGGKAGGR